MPSIVTEGSAASVNLRDACFLALGLAAGVAVHLAKRFDVELRAVPLRQLQSMPSDLSQVLQHAVCRSTTEASAIENPL
jgi:hypothetical protein